MVDKECISKRSKRFYSFFFSYMFLLLIILLLLVAVVYVNFIETMIRDAESSNISSLQQIKSTTDIRLREMEKIAVNISLDNNLKPYIVSNVGVDSLSTINQLHKYKVGNDFTSDILLYHKYKENRKIYSTETVDTIDSFFTNIYKFSEYDSEDFVGLTGTIKEPTILKCQDVYVNGTAVNSFATFVYPLPLDSLNPYTYVFFLIEKQSLLNMIKNILDNYQGYVYILDESGKPIVYLGENNVAGNGVELLNTIDANKIVPGIQQFKIDKIKYSVSKVNSDYNGWSFITIIPTDQFMGKVYNRIGLFFLAALIVLITGGCIAFVLALSNYRPLRKLAYGLTKQHNIADQKVIDEYNIISSVFNEVSQKNQVLTEKLSSQAEYVKDKFVEEFLKRENICVEDKSNLHEGLIFENPKFLVGIFHIENSETYNEWLQNFNNPSKLIGSIAKILEDNCRFLGKGYAVELLDDNAIALLINLKEAASNTDSINEFAVGIKKIVKEKYNLTMMISFGKIYDSLNGIHTSYIESKRAADFRFIKGMDNIIFFDEIESVSFIDHNYPTELENRLVTNLRLGNSEIVSATLDDIKDYICRMVSSPEIMQYIYFGLIKAVNNLLDEMEINLSEDLKLHREKLFNKNIVSIHVIFDNLKFICIQICFLCNGNKESKNYELRDKIIRIIQENYKDQSVTLEYIAQNCGMSASYISRFFKDQTGYPPMQYLDMLRLESAKRLLKSSDASLREILDQVGYVDESNFVRKFKKKEGITPLQYRNMIKKIS